MAAHQRLAQAQRGVDDRFAALAGQRIGGEEHARRLALHHRLHDHGQRHIVVGDAVARTIGDGACGPQAAPATDDRAQQGLLAHDIQEGVLLAGEAHVGQVFGGGRGAHCDRRPAQRVVGRGHGI